MWVLVSVKCACRIVGRKIVPTKNLLGRTITREIAQVDNNTEHKRGVGIPTWGRGQHLKELQLRLPRCLGPCQLD